MSFNNKITVVFLAVIFAFFAFSSRAKADELLDNTLKGAAYGGIVGGLLGGAVMLLTDKPDHHLGYIATGAAVGVLAGTAYGIASSGVVQSAGEYKDGRFSFHIPTIKIEKVFDVTVNSPEIIESVDILRLKF